jgi:hypothetical protein
MRVNLPEIGWIAQMYFLFPGVCETYTYSKRQEPRGRIGEGLNEYS